MQFSHIKLRIEWGDLNLLSLWSISAWCFCTMLLCGLWWMRWTIHKSRSTSGGPKIAKFFKANFTLTTGRKDVFFVVAVRVHILCIVYTSPIDYWPHLPFSIMLLNREMTVTRFSFLPFWSLNWHWATVTSTKIRPVSEPEKRLQLSETDSLLVVWCAEKTVGGGMGGKTL